MLPRGMRFRLAEQDLLHDPDEFSQPMCFLLAHDDMLQYEFCELIFMTMDSKINGTERIVKDF